MTGGGSARRPRHRRMDPHRYIDRGGRVMMKTRTARRLRSSFDDDRGITMVEVVVAMVIFAMIAVGVAQGIVISTKIAADAQNRTVALNLNSSQLDFVRTQSPYAVSSTSQSTPTATTNIDGITYTTWQTVAWVGLDGADRSCGAVNSSFQLMRVRVQTVWTGQLSTSPDATSDALLSSDNTIKDPGNGTIFIKVTKADGSPYADLQLTAKSTDGTALAVPKTNSDGCAFITKVAPGSYTVTASTTGNIDRSNSATSVSPVLNVTAGSAVPVSLDYDVDTSIRVTYQTNQSDVHFPSNFVTTWFTASTVPPYYRKSGTPGTVDLFPSPKAGYSGVAGPLVPASNPDVTTCLSPDPSNWDAGTVGGAVLLDGARPDPATAVAGGNPSYSVPVGVLQAQGGPSDDGYTIVATSAPATAGDPGCATGMTYTFSVSGSSPKLALPYGTWSLAYSQRSRSGPLRAQALTNDYPTAPDVVATLDPRETR